MQLRPYQQDIIEKCRISFMSGHKRPLVVLPCGAGKTVCFAYMAEEHVKKGGKVWFLVHRKELIDQTTKIINNKNVYVGMVGTVLKNAPFDPTLIIFDEAHHSSAATWQKIINKYYYIPIIGLTATPCRLDGKPLGNIYDDLIVGVSSEWLMQNKYLCDYDYYAPSNLIKDFNSDVENVGIEFESKVYGDVLKYIDPNKKTIIYCPNIKFSDALSTYIPNSVHFDGNTPKKERDKIIEDFRTGNIKILLNVDLIGEGFDVPDCECCVLLRPTMSTALYIQQSMRCLRPNQNKRAVIYDFVGNVFRHGMPTENREWDLNTQIKVRNKSAEPEILTRQCKKCFRIYKGVNKICPYCGNDNGKTKKQIEIEKQIELEQIRKVERKQVGMARTEAELIEIGKKRGYKNPYYWAKMVIKGRNDNRRFKKEN